MNTLVEWIGKTEDIQIMYDAGIAKNSLLLAANDGITANFPAIIYPFPDNIREVEALDIDLIGFIFWSKSSRYVSEKPDYLPTKCKRVGVFVDEAPWTMREIGVLSRPTSSSRRSHR